MKKLIILIIPLAAIAYLFTRAPSVVVTKPTRGESVNSVFATGSVEASIMYPVSTKSMGKLIVLNVDEGTEVKKDQILAKLEDQKLVNIIEELQAKETYLIGEFNRQKKLLDIKATARDIFEKSKSELDATRAAIKGAIAQLEDLSIIAPADAKVIKRDGEIGQIIGANQTVFWLAEKSPLRISAEVDEEDIAKVKVGQLVLIRSDAFENQVFKGEVHSITPKGDPITRSYRVRITFTEDVPLLIGMTTENNIILNKVDNALLIPASAVKKDQVWLVEDNKLSLKKIEIGAKDLKMAEVISGLNEKDEIVLEFDEQYKAGQKVNIKR